MSTHIFSITLCPEALDEWEYVCFDINKKRGWRYERIGGLIETEMALALLFFHLE
jgi:hypothetical protein